MDHIDFLTRVKLAWLALTNPTALVVAVVGIGAGLMNASLKTMIDRMESCKSFEKQSYAPGGQKERGE